MAKNTHTDREPVQPPAELPEDLTSKKTPGGDWTDVEEIAEVTAGPDADPVSRAYARTGRADTTGTNGIPADDEDAGEERKKLYKDGAGVVSRID